MLRHAAVLSILSVIDYEPFSLCSEAESACARLGRVWVRPSAATTDSVVVF